MSRVEMAAQMRAAMNTFACNSTDLSDKQALEMPQLFPTWEEVLSEKKELAKDRVIRKDDVLYRVVQAVTPQEHQPPDGAGMLAIYRPIELEHAGTLEDPIPWVYGMDCYAGKYYAYDNHIYLVVNGGSMLPCVYAPDSGIWQWQLIQ